MVVFPERGFPRAAVSARYNVQSFEEDQWHSHAAEKTKQFIAQILARRGSFKLLLNAGSGIYAIEPAQGREISVDLFHAPLRTRTDTVCADVQSLPFRPSSFDVVICVGEVLGYCDPATAIKELARVLTPGGTLICDFENSRGAVHWFKKEYGRAADIATQDYNGTPERTWIYDPGYIKSLLSTNQLDVVQILSTYTWSSLARRMGIRAAQALTVEATLSRFVFPSRWAGLTTFVAEKLRDASQ